VEEVVDDHRGVLMLIIDSLLVGIVFEISVVKKNHLEIVKKN